MRQRERGDVRRDWSRTKKGTRGGIRADELGLNLNKEQEREMGSNTEIAIPFSDSVSNKYPPPAGAALRTCGATEGPQKGFSGLAGSGPLMATL